MFKVGRWRNEKIKVVFKLQFLATQVPCSKSRLMISLVPVDVGQPTVRLGKAVVQDGICTWESPVYEAVKFTRETKTGKLQDKIYQFIVSTGSSKAGFLGEVSLNLADYAEAMTPFTISLPIKSSNSGAILHVTVQNMEGADNQRELHRDTEENGALKAKTKGSSLQSQLSNSISDGDANHSTNEDQCSNTTVSPDDRGRRNHRNGNTLNYMFKQKDNGIHHETCSNESPNRENSVPKALNAVAKEHQTEPSILDWSSEEDIVNYVDNSKENFPREREQEPPKSLIEQLEQEIFNLKRQAEVTDIELQSLRRQVVKENKRGQELSGQVLRLREERDALRQESEKLRSWKKGVNGIEHPKEMRSESKDAKDRLNEVEEELIHAKDLNKALRSQLRKTQDSNSELILVVKGLEQKVDKKDKELANLSSKMTSERKAEESSSTDSEYKLVNDKQVQKAPVFSSNSKEVDILQEQIKEHQGQLEGHVKEKRELEKLIEQFSQDYEISKKENDDLSSKFNQKQLELIKKERECAYNTRKVEELECQIARLEKVIKKQAEEFSESSHTMNDLENQVNDLKYELERRAEEFEDDLKALTDAKFEQEQRALEAEENLRKTNLDNAKTAQRLQEEFSELSEELASKFKENEELTIKAETEARELCLHITVLEENLQKANKELELVQEQCVTEVQRLSSQLTKKEKQLEQFLLAHENEIAEFKSTTKHAEDKCEAFSNENQALRIEVERVTEENYYFIKQLQEMKTLLDETKTALEATQRDRDDYEKKYTLVRKDIKQSQEKLKTLRSLKEKEDAIDGVKAELENLRAQHNELKHQCSELKLENENLRKQVNRQRENLQKKDQEIAHFEKLKNSSSKEVSAVKEKVKQLKAVRPAGVPPENGSKVEERKFMGRKFQHTDSSGKSLQNGASRVSGESRRETCSEKKVPDSRISDLLTEVASLKEKNKAMEDELKEMQEKYSDVSLKFAEVEGERQQLVMTIRNLRNGQKK